MGRELLPEGPLFEHPVSGTLGTPSAVNLIECPGKGLSQFPGRVFTSPSTSFLASKRQACDRTDLASQGFDSAFG